MSCDETILMRINSVGIGAGGVAVLRQTLSEFPDLECRGLQLMFPEPADIQPRSVPADSFDADVLFIVVSPATDEALSQVRQITHAADTTGVLAVILVSSPCGFSGELKGPDGIALPVFFLPDETGLSRRNTDSIHHVMSTLVTLLRHDSFIGLDFVDIEAVLRSGTRGWFGFGAVDDMVQSADACKEALSQLDAQGLGAYAVKGMLGIVRCADWDGGAEFALVAETLRAFVPESSYFIMGFVQDARQHGMEIMIFALS